MGPTIELSITQWECDLQTDGTVTNGRILSQLGGGQIGSFSGQFSVQPDGITTDFTGTWSLNGGTNGTIRGARFSDMVLEQEVCN